MNFCTRKKVLNYDLIFFEFRKIATGLGFHSAGGFLNVRNLFRRVALIKTTAGSKEFETRVALHRIGYPLYILGTVSALHELQGKILPLFALPFTPICHSDPLSCEPNQGICWRNCK